MIRCTGRQLLSTFVTGRGLPACMPSESISSTQYRILVLNDAYVKEQRREIQTHVCHTSIQHTQLTASRKEPPLQAVACTSRGCWWRAARAAGRATWRPRSCTRWRGSPSIPLACLRSLGRISQVRTALTTHLCSVIGNTGLHALGEPASGSGESLREAAAQLASASRSAESAPYRWPEEAPMHVVLGARWAIPAPLCLPHLRLRCTGVPAFTALPEGCPERRRLQVARGGGRARSAGGQAGGAGHPASAPPAAVVGDCPALSEGPRCGCCWRTSRPTCPCCSWPPPMYPLTSSTRCAPRCYLQPQAADVSCAQQGLIDACPT